MWWRLQSTLPTTATVELITPTKTLPATPINDDIPIYRPYIPRTEKPYREDAISHIPTVTPTGRLFDKKAQAIFIACLPTQTQIILNQDFGKPNLSQCFHLVPTVCHVLLPIIHAGFLSVEDLGNLARTCKNFYNLSQLLQEHKCIDFTTLRDPPPLDWNDEKGISTDRIQKVTAALTMMELKGLIQHVGGMRYAGVQKIP